jgi:hypothetical protein
VYGQAPMNDAKDNDGGVEAAMCSSAATSSTLAEVDDDVGAGLPACSHAPMDSAKDDDDGAEAAMCSSAATSSTLPRAAPKTRRVAWRLPSSHLRRQTR